MGNTSSEMESSQSQLTPNANRKNHFNNIEIQKTVLKNKTMQKQFLDRVNDEMVVQKKHIKTENYSKVNGYLSNLNLNDYDKHHVQDYLNINDGYIEPEQDTSNNLKKIRKNNIDKTIINYEYLFGLNKNYTLEELKNSYKKLVIATHPDRPKGSEKKFKIVAEGYKKLLENYKKRQIDKQFMELRDQSKEYIEKQKGEINIDMTNKDDFDINIFNKVFKNNRLDDINDSGYEDWIKSNSYSTEEITKTIKGDFNINNFNSSFKTSKKSNEIIKYEEPQALDLSTSKLSCSILGEDNINSFSKQEMKNKDLNYSDYREAYTVLNTINPGEVKYKEYKNIDHLKNDRKNVSFDLSEQERQNLYIKKKKQELNDNMRQERLRNNDQKIFDNYNKINKILLKR